MPELELLVIITIVTVFVTLVTKSPDPPSEGLGLSRIRLLSWVPCIDTAAYCTS